MNPPRYTLQPYKGMWSRYTCPQCLRHKVFSRYIDTTTEEPIADDVGRCSREVNCGYHYKPSEYFQKNGKPPNHGPSTRDYRPLTYRDFEPSYIPKRMIGQTVKHYEINNFVRYLAARFGREVAYTQAQLYLVGTSKHWPGACIFWQVDSADKVRTGKIMLYNPETGKRVKQPFNHIAWAHKLLRKSGSRESQQSPEDKNPAVQRLSDFRSSGLSDYNLKQCLFGEHLLQYQPAKAVAICESEKTAIIASIYYPELLWLAAGSLQGLNVDKCKCLEGRTVILMPDVNAYELWVTKATQLSAALPSVNFKVMRLLEDNATHQQKTEGWDIADYL
ncbi:DUF6371 domain-containing protein [Mucilaginibacter sp. OK098]|uniref:DUF6371 domain-containing protein n=1 Tax=Mucilaginibacter sp. OK098 TaxID=1855297 RepID=UPI0009239C97|nr:DUF6371 domain-containing protein [Mucilaginibacter sp. OK098]SHN10674.1 hypothetical protein SAMN05216524_105251 [Mucilaginibacter sp. OK098]